MSWQPYRAETYLDWPAVEAWCTALAEAHPSWVRLETVGASRQNRSLLLLTLGNQSGDTEAQPAVWIDGGTHASEYTGVSAALFTASRWVEALIGGDADMQRFFSDHTAYILPCISPDGYQAMHEGAPFIRSSLREPTPELVREGFDPCDIDGDGVVRWMRFKHPAGPFVQDPDVPMFMRHRTLDDDPEDCWFVCDEGLFLEWDGASWKRAPTRFGVDLNRNFPSHWKPFSMFGMDGGHYALSEPEARALIDAVHARPNIAAALTNHTYTGCILTQPYRDPSPLQDNDIKLMNALARDAVEGTGYTVFKTHPDFKYHPKIDIVGVWADTLATVLGIPGYTVEFWNPYGHAGVELEKPAAFFMDPDETIIRSLIQKFCEDPNAYSAWTPFEHPQLGPVEIGGIDYLRTIRNPPEHLLAGECEKGLSISDRVRRALPTLSVETHLEHLGADVYTLSATFTNLGFLPTSGLHIAETQGISPGIAVDLSLPDTLTLVDGAARRDVGHLDGWGDVRVGAGSHMIYAGLPARGPRARLSWTLKGSGGDITLRWSGGRVGRGDVTVSC